MNLVDVHCYRLAVGRVYRHMALDPEGAAQPPTVWRSASNYIVYELETDTGLKGIGEISDFRDNIGQLDPPQLRCLFLAALKGIDLRHRRRAWEAVRQALPPSLPAEFRQLVAASVDIALLDLAGKYFGAPAYELLGGRVREVVPVSWVSYMRPAALLEDEIKEKLREGYKEFKLKAGAIEVDLERVRTFRQIAGDQVFLRIDASGLWAEEDEAIDNIKRLAELGVQAVETPLAAASRTRGLENPETVGEDAPAALARVRRAVPVPLIEHVGDFSDEFALALVKHRAVDVFNVIPVQTGSLHRAQRLVHLAEQAGIQAMLGSTVELGPGLAASLHLALASAALGVASDLVSPGFLVDDVVEPQFKCRNGTLSVPQAPGLGIRLEAQKLQKYRLSSG